MLILRCLVVVTLLMLLFGGTVRADSGAGVGTPGPSAPVEPPPTSVPIVPPQTEPTDVPIATVAPPVAEPTQPPVESAPVTVKGETPGHLVSTPAPVVSAPAPGSGTTRPTQPGTAGSSSSSSTTAPSPGVSLGPASSTQPGLTVDPGNSSGSLISLSNSTGDPAASAPTQLNCGSKQYPAAEPFMVSPFADWTTINSFVDHDYPDYAVDGKIILANGLVARASEGQASDFFPAYWSTSLRQYVNYDGHNGYDFGISYQPVLAAAAGTVTYAGWNGPDESSGYGQMILIDHHNGYVTLYGHLSTLEVHKGDHVTAGEEIGISGTTGHSSGPHLHFSVFHNCNVTDPYGWTGSRDDPLHGFDGESSQYLWLPGHDPLILNPPPNWPAFPAGLHLKLPAIAERSRTLPPVDRLLLLTLPNPSPAAGLTAGPALARTESAITQEAQVLTPYLDDLRSRGDISAYEVIPAAAAVWVRGTADAATLEALPGVASLSGVSPTDLTAAQTGLAHSVLIQLGKQQAPSLWPVGFRSALHAWRPVVTAVTGHALVAGYALPGEKVTLAIQRDGSAPGAAETTTDPQTGGFVAMLHDSAGMPVSVRHGDTVEVQSGGRQASVSIAPFTIHTHLHSLTGRSSAGASVPITLIPADGGPVKQIISAADTHGHFRVTLPDPLQAGSLAIASAVDGGGDQESAAAYAPGMMVDLAESTVTGWLTAHDPSLQVWRHGREVYSHPLSPATDGSFRLGLQQQNGPLSLKPGDDVSIGSAWHRLHAVVPPLGVSLSPGASEVRVIGPAGAGIRVTWNRRDAPWERTVTTDRKGLAMAVVTGPRIGIGDSARVLLETRGGDDFVSSQRVRGVVIHEYSDSVSGQTAAGSRVSVRLLGPNAVVLATGRAQSDAVTGAFTTRLLNTKNRPVQIEPGSIVNITDDLGTQTVRVPQLELTTTGSRRLEINAPGNRTASLIWIATSGHVGQIRLRLNGAGLANAPLRSGIKKATVSVVGPGSVLFQRSIHFHPSCRKCGTAGGR